MKIGRFGVLAASVGVVLLTPKNVVIELALRSLVLVGNQHGGHVMLGPTIAADFAF